MVTYSALGRGKPATSGPELELVAELGYDDDEDALVVPFVAVVELPDATRELEDDDDDEDEDEFVVLLVVLVVVVVLPMLALTAPMAVETAVVEAVYAWAGVGGTGVCRFKTSTVAIAAGMSRPITTRIATVMRLALPYVSLPSPSWRCSRILSTQGWEREEQGDHQDGGEDDRDQDKVLEPCRFLPQVHREDRRDPSVDGRDDEYHRIGVGAPRAVVEDDHLHHRG
jgi:hypothetical protein